MKSILELKAVFYSLLETGDGREMTNLIVRGMKIVDALALEQAGKNECEPAPQVKDEPPEITETCVVPPIAFAYYCIEKKLKLSDAKNLARDTMIDIAMKKSNGNKTEAAELCGMTPVNFQILLKRLNNDGEGNHNRVFEFPQV